MKFEELQAKIAGAKDMKEAKGIIADYNKTVVDEKKKEALAIQKENEALAGLRETLAINIWKTIKELGYDQKMSQVKAQGFTYKLDTDEVKYKSVALTVPGAKRVGGGGGGGNTGLLKAETGMSRSELIETYATDAEKQAVATARASATTRPDSASYQASKPVIKRILADNPSLIKK